MKGKIVTSLFFIFVGVTSIFFFLIALLIRVFTYPFDKRLRLLHLFTCFWGSLYTYIMPPWKIKVEGRKKIQNNVPYVFVSNHQSQLDILVAFRLYKHFKWVSKAEIFNVPVIGWNMFLNRYVRLFRGVKESAARMMQDCEMHLKEGSPVFIFPEGTRSPDGHLKEFKLGAFILAKNLNVPILPVIIEGTRFALPKYSIDYHGQHQIIMRVLDEITPDTFKDMTVEQLAQYTWHYMNNEMRKLRIEMYGQDDIKNN
ncbi:MAG: lysophospholipid acyltransferase family protein [Spirochaetota bacterium]